MSAVRSVECRVTKGRERYPDYLSWSRTPLIGGLIALVLAATACTEPGGPPEARGRVLWRVPGEGFWPAPTFDDATVYFIGRNHDLVAVDKHAGTVRWQQLITSETRTTDIGAEAVVAGNVVAVADLDVFGFDRATGARLWAFRPQYSRAGWVGIATDGQTVFAGFDLNRAYAIDAATGGQRWVTVVTPDSNAWIKGPVVKDNVVYYCISYPGSLYDRGAVAALHAADGRVLWLRDFPSPATPRHTGCFERVAVAGSLVIAIGKDGRLYAVDRVTGDFAWTSPSPAVDSSTYGPIYGPIAALDTMFFTGTNSGSVSAYDARNGRLLWRATAEQGSIGNDLAVDTGQVVVRHLGGQLAAFDFKSGRLLWVEGAGMVGAEYSGAPAIDVDRLYVGGYHGFYALKKH